MSCARCGAALHAAAGAHSAGIASTADHGLDLTGIRPTLELDTTFDDWRADQAIRLLKARAKNPRRVGLAAPVARPIEPNVEHRVDAPHARHQPPHRQAPRGIGRTAIAFWTALSLGLTAFAAGAMLGWTFAEERPAMWNFGYSMMVAGQAGLLFALVLQLDPIWQNGRRAVSQLDQVGSQLKDLKRTTALLGTTQGAAAQAFYAHMAEQASPELLVADLKGQLDMLAVSMANRGA